jgi:F-box/WD-40 domain protein 7
LNSRVWDVSSKLPYHSLNLLGHSGTIRCLHLDGELNRLVSGSADSTIKVIYDDLRGCPSIWVPFNSKKKTLKVWDLSDLHATWSRVTCKMTLLGHSGAVRCLQVKDALLISGSYDHTLKIWNLKNGLCTKTLT